MPEGRSSRSLSRSLHAEDLLQPPLSPSSFHSGDRGRSRIERGRADLAVKWRQSGGRWTSEAEKKLR